MNAASDGTAPASRLGFKTKIFYGIGNFAEAVALFSITSYALLFYNQIHGLPAHLAGLALSISLLLDGPSDLFMGYISDRTRSRFGRRHLYMYVAPLPIALLLYAVFNPPAGFGQGGLFIWLAGSVILLRQVMNIFHTPHSALGGELSTDYSERSTVQAYGSFSISLGATFQSWAALTFFFAATPDYPKGVLNPEPWPMYAATMASLVLVGLYASAWFTRDRIPYLPQPPAEQPRFSGREFMRNVAFAFSNRNYTMLIIGYFFLTMTTGIRSGISLYTNTFYWHLPSEELRWLALSSLFGALAAFVLTSRLHRRFDKKPTIIAASVLQAVAPAIPVVLSFAGLLSPSTPGLVWILVLFQAIGWFGYGVLTIGVLSAMADVADENELRYGLRQEGVMYAMRNMFGKVDQAIGAAVAGFILTWIAFPVKAKVGEVPYDTVVKIAFSDGIVASIPGLIAIVPYLFYRINRRSHEETKRALAARKAQPATEVDGNFEYGAEH